MNIGILTIPYINSDKHLELAVNSLKSFVSSKHNLLNLAVINLAEETDIQELRPFYQFMVENTKNNLHTAWNLGITKLLRLGCDYVIVPNLDVEFTDYTIDTLVDFAESTKEGLDCVLWSGRELTTKEELASYDRSIAHSPVESPHFSCFMVDHLLFSEVGKFDEGLKVYHGDNDMHRRIKLAGYKAELTHAAPFYHYGSATLRQSLDSTLERNVGVSVSEPYYIAKHGGRPGEEQFDYPFNNPELSWFIK